LWYCTGVDGAIALTEQGEGLTELQLFDRHFSIKGERGGALAPDPDATYITFLLERDFGKVEGVFLPSRGKCVKVSSIPLAPEGFDAYEGGRASKCIAADMGWPECHKPIRTLLNGWSAGPCQFCSQHLAATTRRQGESGLWWRPVRLPLRDITYLAGHNYIP
jgi:hypothetical protein